ncbi:polyprotein [megrivirus B3CP-APO]|uniref:Genome polyprotein n=1 Tax=Goose megrivirus TaxID=1960206 RepID=A0A1S6GNC9_9PICO|nr:polyprotein [megrivirus B3CP-APO]AQS23375.1 polyprotein [megrivirus B3CP-APO]
MDSNTSFSNTNNGNNTQSVNDSEKLCARCGFPLCENSCTICTLVSLTVPCLKCGKPVSICQPTCSDCVPFRYTYQNGDSKPEDNTPLQAQQEDTLSQRLPFESSTSETTLAGATPNQTLSIPDVAWTGERTLDSDIPQILSVMEWNTSAANGTILTTAEQAGTNSSLPQVNPIALPYHLLTNSQTPDGGWQTTNVANNIFGALYQRHALYRSGFHVEVSINGTQFHSGSLLVVAVPTPHLWMANQTGNNPDNPKNYSILDISNFSQLGVFPSARLLPRSNSAVTLDLPFVGQAPVLSTDAMDIQWMVFVFVETKLGIPTTGSAPALTVVVKAAPRKAMFWAPHRPERTFGRLGTLRNTTSTTPAPASVEYNGLVNTGEAMFSNLEERSGAVVVRRRGSPSPSFLPARVESFRSVISIPTLMGTCLVTNSTPVGTVLFQTQVNPLATPTTQRQGTGSPAVTTQIGQPYLWDLARYFTQWRGSLQFTIEFTGPAITSGRLLLAFQPGTNRFWKGGSGDDYVLEGATLQVLTQGPHVIWDVSNSTSASLNCPYSVPTPWAPITPVQDNMMPQSNSTSGTFFVALLTQFNTPTIVSPSNPLLIYVSAGPDFDLRFPAPVPIIQRPLYNGILDQGPESVQPVVGASFVTTLDSLDLGTFFHQSRFYGTFSATTGSTNARLLTIPLSLVNYGYSTTTAATVVENPFRNFTNLFTFIKADLRLTIGIPFSANVVVAYRPPGTSSTVFSNAGATAGSQAPNSLDALLNGGAVVLSTRASNMGVEVNVPFSSFASVFQTTNNRLQRTDLQYQPNESQFDPGDLGTVFVAARVNSQTLSNVSIFIGLDNAEFYLPRPFGPRAVPTAAPASLLPNPESFSWEEVEEMDTMPPLEEEPMDTEYQNPRKCPICNNWMIGRYCWKCDKFDGVIPVCKRCHYGEIFQRGFCKGCYQLVFNVFVYEMGPVEFACETLAPYLSNTPESDLIAARPIAQMADLIVQPAIGAIVLAASELVGYKAHERIFGTERSAEDMLERGDFEREEVIRASYEAPTPFCAPHCGGVDRWLCRCDECLDWINEMVAVIEDGYQIDDGGRIEFNLRLHGFLPMSVEVAEYLGWNFDQLVEARPGWSVESLLSEIQDTEEIEAEWRMQLLDELPLEFPVGPDYPGQWYDNEWYREFLPSEKTSPFPWHDTPYSKALLVSDPSRLCRFYHFLWNDTRYITWLSLHGKHLEALEMARNHPARRVVVPIKLGAEFVKVTSMADERRSSFILERDLAEVRATAMTNTVKASALFRSALRRAEYRRLTSWEEGEVKKTLRFLLSLEEESDEEFFQDDEPFQCEYEAPLGNLPAPPGPPGVRINTQQVAEVAAQHGVVVSQDNGEEVDDEPPETPYVYKVNRGVYYHWGIAFRGQAISLQQQGMGAVVALTNYDLPRAEKVDEIGMYEWFRAVCMLGQEFEDYNIQNNCTHFVEVITGNSYQNTGTWLLAGLGAAALATAFIFQSPKVGPVAMRLKSLETGIEPKKTTRWVRFLRSIPRHREHVFRRTMFFGRREQLPRRIFQNPSYNAPINITLSNPRVEQTANVSAVALQQTLQTYNEMAPQISAAVTAAAAALQDTSMKAGDFVDRLENLVTSTTEFLPKMASTTAETASSIFGDLSRNIGSMILKIIGYTLIIFGNPNPSTVAGVISLMAAEALTSRFLRDKIRSLAVSLSHKLQSLFTSCFGLSVCADDPEIFEDIPFNTSYADFMRERTEYEAPEPSVTQSFNQTVLAMKNIDWIIQKIKELIEFTINKLKGKKEKNPEGWLKSRADYMVKLYDDSVQVGSCQNVDQSLLKKRMEETSEMLAFAVNNRMGQPAALLSKTLGNYRQAQRKLNAASYHDRPEPLVVYIHGGPGCGKSVLSNLIASAYCKRMGLPFSTSVFTTPPGSEFFDGYTGQPVHIIDDFCQNTTGEDVKLFCQMVSTTRFSPPMASLEEKGVNYCSKLIIATSNLATPQSNEVRIPAALERRCHIRVKTSLHPAFTTPAGTLDMVAAFKELGPAKSCDFKVDCPYLNGAAVSCSVRAGGDRRAEKLSVYELMEMIYDELDRRDSCQDLFRNVCYQAPQPGDSRCYDDGVVPTLCSHQDHESANCRRVFFRKGDEVWHRDFETYQEMRDFMDAYHLGKLPEGKEIRPCPCLDPHCGKLLFIGESSAKTFDFRSKSAMDFFLFNHGGSFKFIDPQPKEFVPTAKPQKEENIEEIKKSLTRLQKSCLISFGITALGALSTLIGAIIWLVRRNRRQSEAPYAGMPGAGRPARTNHPRPIPTRNIKYEGQNLPQIYPKIEKNTFSITFRNAGKTLFSLSGLGIAGRVAIGNYHGFSRADQVTIFGKTYDLDDLKPTRIVRNGHPTDLCVFTLPDGNEFKNITRFFLSVKDRIPRADCVLISRAEKMVCNFWARNVSGKRTVVVDAKDTHEEDTHHNVICYDIPSMPGMCGSPLLSTNSAREVVLGIHFAGTGSTGLAVPVYVEDFKSFLEANLKPIPHPGKPTHVARKSDLKPSPVHGVFPVTHGPAALTKNDKRLNEGVDLDTVMFSKHTPDHPGWPTLEPAMSYVVKDLMHKLGFHPSEKIQMWTLEQAINGEGVMDGIMMNQSPGYPYNTQGRSRRSFFVWNNNRWEPTEELRKEVDRALKNPDQFYFSTFLKDELRPLTKVTAGKTRLVDGDSLPRALAYRMVFGPMFERMLAKHGPEIHSAVGCNPETFWTTVFHQMGPATYPYVFDLDYSCFDSTEPAISFRLMAKYLKPYFEIDVTPFFEALAVSKHVYEGIAYEMEGGMTSGCVGTSMFNCINNSAYIVSALLKLKINPEDVAWICYGDDVIISTHEKALSKRIAQFYAENTNLVVTPASKSGEFPETSTIYDVTFLKRYFQPDSNYPDLIHPYMPLDHLKQSVMWCTDGPFQAKLDSLCFLAFHAGRKDYEEFVNAIDGKAREKGLSFNFKSFEFLMSQWYANFM